MQTPETAEYQTQVATELLHRTEAEDDFIKFVTYCTPNYQVQPHHQLIAHKLEQLERGDITRLIICVPPRHGKSTLASINFPAWCLGRSPKSQVICASYNSDLSRSFGRQVRNLIDQDEYRNVFDKTVLAKDQKAADSWNTKQGGVYKSFGVGGGSGFGADLLIIDDPVRTRQDASSDAMRETLWDWFSSTAYPRLMPGGRVLIILTPWHCDDIAGRLISIMEEGGEKYEVVRLPIRAELEDPLDRKPGEALWPDWYDEKAIQRIENAVGPREFQALYMAKPVPDTGDFFRREWFKYWEEGDLPGSLRYYGASDFALTEKETSDYTCHGVVATDDSGNIYLIDWWKGRKPTDETVGIFIDMALQHSCTGWIWEKGQIARSIGPFVDRAMKERGLWVRRMEFARTGDKVATARSFQGRMQQGRVFYPKHKPWMPQLMSEMMEFPAGKHDDQVDVLASFGKLLDDIAKPRARIQAYQANLGWNPIGFGNKPSGF